MNYSYRQCIDLDVRFGGLTKKQAVRARQMDRRAKKAQKNVMAGKAPRNYLERSAYAAYCDYMSDICPN